MKIKRIITVIASTVMCAGFLASCGKVDGPTIGILKWVGVDALNEAERGFVKALADEGYVEGENINFLYECANDKQADAIPQAQRLLRNSDLTLGIATSAATTLQTQSQELGVEKPILFTAVTDPKNANLVASNEHPGGFITGTSDMNPVAEQIRLIKECLPFAQKVGICYNQNEQNSLVQAQLATAAAKDAGLDVQTSTCSSAADVDIAISTLANSVDAIYIPTDNTLADNMATVLANSNGTLICAGEVGQVVSGAHVSLSINYFKLGEMTGRMAAQILKGEAVPADIPVGRESIEDLEYVYSSVNCASSGVTLPSSVIAKSRDVNA